MSDHGYTSRQIVNDLHRSGAIKATKRDYEEAEKIARAVEDLCHLLNSYNSRDELLGEVFNQCLVRQHRSLQQSFWRLMREVIRRYAITHHDMRNEAAVLWCKRAAELDAYLPFV